MPRGRTAEKGRQTIASRLRSRSRQTKSRTPSPVRKQQPSKPKRATTAPAKIATKTTPKKRTVVATKTATTEASTTRKRARSSLESPSPFISAKRLKSTARTQKTPVATTKTTTSATGAVATTSTTKAPDWTLDTTFWDRYELQNSIQKGGFGEVFAAKSIADGQKYAIKLLFEMKPDTIQEVQLMRAARDDYEKCLQGVVCYVEHAIVEWPQKGGQERRYAIVMGFVKGEDLFDLMNTVIMTKKSIDEKVAKELFRSALLALAALHARGIAHRDVKPENLRIVDGNKVVLLDLGLACFKDDEPKCSNQKSFKIGTPCYSSSPEIVAHGYSDNRETLSADVYALATSFLPLFMKQEPLACALHDQGMPLAEAITLSRRPDSPRELHIADEKFAKVVYDMLAPTTAERPTAAEAAQRLL